MMLLDLERKPSMSTPAAPPPTALTPLTCPKSRLHVQRGQIQSKKGPTWRSDNLSSARILKWSVQSFTKSKLLTDLYSHCQGPESGLFPHNHHIWNPLFMCVLSFWLPCGLPMHMHPSYVTAHSSKLTFYTCHLNFHNSFIRVLSNFFWFPKSSVMKASERIISFPWTLKRVFWQPKKEQSNVTDMLKIHHKGWN